ncbi:hypothetical protein AB6A40_004513 [Gnathostoma spinigerum]|uniref:Dystroglycan-type cadherin-like domain-containing protein n=1 Tax=Gnathostoma spinigerum TaxID=75299 RepID=A0ABD6ECP3_9BILA
MRHVLACCCVLIVVSGRHRFDRQVYDRRYSSVVPPIELHVTKGHYFTYTLHSGNFFRQTADAKWTASMKNRPTLPAWLHLLHSRHKAIAYLQGTAISPALKVVIHVIARRIDNYETAEQFITIYLNNDSRYNSSTQQITEIRIKNYEAEELINDRSGLLNRLQNSIRVTFRGKGVNPYIHNLFPAITAPIERAEIIQSHKFGTVIQIGTQRTFHNNVVNLQRGLEANAQYCSKNSIVPLDKYFAPVFDIDWCHFVVKNVTIPHSARNMNRPDYIDFDFAFVANVTDQDYVLNLDEGLSDSLEPSTKSSEIRTRYYFWESFLMFPMLAVCCILLIILLSVIFFGRREGQHWRDFKTPKEQLEEYVSVRESQRHLRELSAQRQLLQMASEPSQLLPTTGVNTFLKPMTVGQSDGQTATRENSSDFQNPKSGINITNDSHPDDIGEFIQVVNSQTTPLGKQTVAEAARACGSSLHLYRNPFENTSDEEQSENQQETQNVTSATAK